MAEHLMEARDVAKPFARQLVRALHAPERLEDVAPRVAEHRLQHLLLGGEVVVQETVGDAGLLGDVADPAVVVAASGEDPDRRVEQEPALLLLGD